MDSIRVSEAPDPGSIPGKATKYRKLKRIKITKNASNPTHIGVLEYYFEEYAGGGFLASEGRNGEVKACYTNLPHCV